MSSSSSCYLCGEHVEAAFQIEHFGCKCKAHAQCLEEPINYKYCTSHDPTAPKVVGSPVRATVRGSGGFGPCGAEPRTTDGINWILNPGAWNPEEPTLRKVGALISSRFAETVDNSKRPIYLLRNHVPVRTIMERNGLGMDHFCAKGVTLGDFLDNGYVWDDLMQFEAVAGRRGGVTPLQAVAIGLQAQATHFRDYPTAFPYEVVRAHTGFEPFDLHELFGLKFPDDGPLECAGDTNWNALHCVSFGLTADDLVAMGMQYVEQYEDLMHGLPIKKQQEASKALGFTEQHLKSLVSLQEAAAAAASAAAAMAAQVQTQLRAQPVQQQQQEEEVPLEEEYVEGELVEEEQPEPVVAPLPVRRIYQGVRTGPVAIDRPAAPVPIFTHRTPPPKPAPAQVPLAQRRAARFDRHGATFVK